ncbi:MAG: DUF4231 domain-containing protein [Lachnospiraceae bacterium]|nr:DUF4231 domain-containing protein [Lachnospiraceae bacterium]
MNKKISIDEYMHTRVDSQIELYEKKACSYQRKYRTSQTIEIILAALIPLLSSYADNLQIIGFIVGVFGAAIAIIKSLSRLYQWPENWLGYRTACDQLRYQKMLFETGSAPYNLEPETIEHVFIHNIEQVISSEHKKWKALVSDQSAEESINKSAEE